MKRIVLVKILISILFYNLNKTHAQEINLQFLGPLSNENFKEISILKRVFKNRKITINSLYDNGIRYDFETKTLNDFNVSKNTRYTSFENTLISNYYTNNLLTKLFVWPKGFKLDDLSSIVQSKLRGSVFTNKKGELPLKKPFLKAIKSNLKQGLNTDIIYLSDTLDYEYSCYKLPNVVKEKKINWLNKSSVGPSTIYLREVASANYYILRFEAPSIPLDAKLELEVEDYGKLPISLNLEYNPGGSITGPNDFSIFLQKASYDNILEIYVPYVLLVNKIEQERSRLRKESASLNAMVNKHLSNAITPDDILTGLGWRVSLSLYRKNCNQFPQIQSEKHILIFSCNQKN
jgi:hypothetical protein